MYKLRNDIYPRTLENIKAVLLYYFPEEKHSTINIYAAKLYDERVFQINEIEYIAEIIYNHSAIFKKHYHDLSIQATFNACYNALFVAEENWNISKNGVVIFKTIKEELEIVI
jgi:hypothetical protein